MILGLGVSDTDGAPKDSQWADTTRIAAGFGKVYPSPNKNWCAGLF